MFHGARIIMQKIVHIREYTPRVLHIYTFTKAYTIHNNFKYLIRNTEGRAGFVL